MNLRRPLPFFLLTLLLAGSWSCDHLKSHFVKNDSRKTASPQQDSSSYSEADRTREMEQKADDINRQAEDLKNMEGSDQDKIDAYNKLQQSQQDLNAQSEGGN